MKAAIIEQPGKLVIKEIPDPVPGDHECLCRNLYCSTCTGTDLHLIYGYKMPFKVRYPTILGHESIGRVIKTGSKVKNFKVGDLVLCNRNT